MAVCHGGSWSRAWIWCLFLFVFFSFVFFWFACEDEVISITEMFTWWIIKQGKAPFKGWTHFWPEPLAFCTTPHPSFSVPSCLVMMTLIQSVQNFWQDFLSLQSLSYWASQILSVSDILIWGTSSLADTATASCHKPYGWSGTISRRTHLWRLEVFEMTRTSMM